MYRLLALGALLVTHTAAAQTLTLDKQDDSLFKGNVQFGIGLLDEPDTVLLNTQLYVQGSYKGFGGYGHLQIHSAFNRDDDDSPDPEVSNVDFGAFYVRDFDPLKVAFRIGFAVPTASDGLGPLILRSLSSFSRLTDYSMNVVRGFTLRTSVSPMLSLGLFWLRADVGFDFLFATEDDFNAELLRLNLGLGVDISLIRLGVELVNLGNMRAVDDDASEAFLHTLAVFAQVRIGPAALMLGYTTPLDEGPRGSLHIINVGASVTF